MNQLPPFFQSLLSTIEPFHKRANEYQVSQLSKEELFTKIASDLSVESNNNPEQQLIKASDSFRELFKKTALDAGYTEVYVQGVFNTSEKLCKEALPLGEMAD